MSSILTTKLITFYIVFAFILNYSLAHLPTLRNHTIFYSFFQFVVFGIPALTFIKKTKQSFSNVTYLTYLRMSLIGILLITAQILIFSLFCKVLFEMQSRFNLLPLLSMLVFSPIFEELFFRGICLQHILKLYPNNQRLVVFLSALIFAIFHINIYSMLFSLLPGILLSFIMIKFNSLKACIAVHSIMNLTSILARILYFI